MKQLGNLNLNNLTVSKMFLHAFTAKETFGITHETSIYFVDETGRAVEADLFSEVVQEESDIVWTLAEASSVEGNSSTVKVGRSYLIHPTKTCFFFCNASVKVCNITDII